MTENANSGPAKVWIAAVDRTVLAGKTLSAAIKFWNETGSEPAMEKQAWETVSNARSGLTLANDAEASAFTRLIEAQSQTEMSFNGETSDAIEDSVAQAPEMVGAPAEA